MSFNQTFFGNRRYVSRGFERHAFRRRTLPAHARAGRFAKQTLMNADKILFCQNRFVADDAVLYFLFFGMYIGVISF